MTCCGGAIVSHDETDQESAQEAWSAGGATGNDQEADGLDVIADLFETANPFEFIEEAPLDDEGVEPPATSSGEDAPQSAPAGKPTKRPRHRLDRIWSVDRGYEPARSYYILRACSAQTETDIGNGRRFLKRHGGNVIAIQNLGMAVYDGKRWFHDFDESVIRPLAHETAEAVAHEALLVRPWTFEKLDMEAGLQARPRHAELRKKANKRTPEEETEYLHLGDVIDRGAAAAAAVAGRRTRRVRFAKSCCMTGKIENMLTEAKVYRTRPISVFDRDAYALNVENGTLRFFKEDGKPWQVRLDRHNRKDMISKLMPIVYDPQATCPTFERFFEAVQPDEMIALFLQRFFGYALTSLTTEQVFLFLYGLGANGKSTLVDLISKMMADYATTVPFETLAGDDRRKGGDATPDLVRVPGARLVRASEPETGMNFRESMIKSLTSSEPILIRRMREEFVEIYPSFKLVISGNHKPNIKGADEGIWRRVLLVPFAIQIPQKDRDRQLGDKLWAERSGVLNWLIAGALSYLEQGLGIPDAVRAATDEYREVSDSYAAFLRGACYITGSENDTATPGELHAAYKVFCEKQGFYAVNISTFTKVLPDKATVFGFRKAKSMGLSVYRGIIILDDFKPGAGPSRHPDDND